MYFARGYEHLSELNTKLSFTINLRLHQSVVAKPTSPKYIACPGNFCCNTYITNTEIYNTYLLRRLKGVV